MRDKFIEISLNDLIAKDILYQHDKGQVVRFVEEIGDGTLVLFNNSNVKEDAVPRYVENCSVEIPDRLLETEGSLIVTVKLVDSNSETTQKVVKIKIKSGSKQNEEIEPENQQTFIEQIQDIMTTTKSIAEDVQKRADNGEFDGKDGYTPVKGKDYFTDAEVNQIKNDTREQVVTEITPSLENNLKSAKDYTDNAIIRDFKDITYDETTATFIFTRHDDTTFTVDLPIEQTVKDGRYDDETAELVLVLVSGQEIRIPVTGLIDDYTGVDSATIQVVISADNKITCNIIGGTISKTLLTTELQAEIDGKANRSEMSNLVQEVGGKLLELATTDKESYVAAINELKEDLVNIIYKELINGFDKDNTVGGYLNNNGNVNSDSRFVTSDFFEVHENKTYYALQMVGTIKYENISYICFYDSSKTFIPNGYFNASSCTAPSDSKYARVTFPSDETIKARCMFTSVETPDKYYPFGYEYSIITKDASQLKSDVEELKTGKLGNRLYGKSMTVLGDSMAKGHTLTEEQTWAYKIAKRNNMSYTKLAVNGAFITTGHDNDSVSLVEQVKQITGSPDIIVIHMGTNDRVNNVELGTWTSSNEDTTNINGALRVVFNYIFEHFPTSQVMFITPYYYQEQTDYIGAIEKACYSVGIHCKNNKQGGICAWNTDIRSALFLDTVHLNENGQTRVSYEYEGFMRTFM